MHRKRFQAPDFRARVQGPPREAFRDEEWKWIQRLRTTRQVQEFLRALPYNWEEERETLRTFRGFIICGKAHCFAASLTVSPILAQPGSPSLLLDLESQYKLDHVLFLFRKHG